MEEVIQRLARECAERLITVEAQVNNNENSNSWWILVALDVGRQISYQYLDKHTANIIAASIRNRLTNEIVDVIKTFLTIPPWPSPISEERLREIWQEIAIVNAPQIGRRYKDLKQHFTYLTHLIQVMTNESEGQIYAAGYDAGLKAGRAGE